MTFTKKVEQHDAARRLPLEKMLLETDSPFLTPVPFRGKVNTPERIREIATYLSEHRGESFEEIASQTTKNAQKLFS